MVNRLDVSILSWLRQIMSRESCNEAYRESFWDTLLGGSKSAKTKLTGQEKKIKELLDKKVSYSAIGRILGVHRLTVSNFVKEKMSPPDLRAAL